ncbi:DUF1772 domain-containing protein [Kineococcus sp. T90]|nr:DUF1772 domain-containing protein [Kineococcus indalonis]
MLPQVLLLVALVTSGSLAGLFHAFSCAVLPGLRATSDATFTAAMTSVNAAVRNPLFALVFAGAPLSTAAAAAARALTGQVPAALVAACALHLAALVVTVRANLPLNAALAAAAGDPAAARRGFERAWRRWNAVRGALDTGALACVGVALAAA